MNTHHISKFYNDTAAFLTELVDAMKQPTVRGEWYDKTDIMTDYFDIAYYTDINVGQWDKGYIYTGEEVIRSMKPFDTEILIN